MKNQVLTSALLTGLEAVQKLNKLVDKAFKSMSDTGYITVDHNTLKVHSNTLTGNQTYIKIDIESDIENMTAAFNISQLIKALKKFNHTTGIEILPNSNILFTDGKKKVELKCADYAEIAYIDFSEANSNIVNGLEFKTAYDKVKKTVATELSRPILTGIHFKNDFIESVDGYRISQVKLSGLEYEAFTGFVIDCKVIDIIAAVAKKNKSDIEILNTDKQYQIATKTSDFELYLRGDVMQGEFLNTSQVFNNDPEIVLEFNSKKELQKEIEFIHDMSINEDTKKNPMVVQLSNSKLDLSVLVDGAKTSSTIEIENTSELRIAFNPKYILEAVKNIEDDKFTMNFISHLTPVIIKNEMEKYLVLPIRLNS
ncbi:MAG: hypothetical protein ACRC1P_09845 [Cellulosilyticaceae bacterium]